MWDLRSTCVCRELAHLVTHLCETLKVGKLSCVLVIPPAVAPGYVKLMSFFSPMLFVTNKSNTNVRSSRDQYGSGGYVWARGLWEAGTCGGRVQSDDVRLFGPWKVRRTQFGFTWFLTLWELIGIGFVVCKARAELSVAVDQRVRASARSSEPVPK